MKLNFDRIFSAYGPPEVTRDDNGAAFDSTGPCRLAQLSGWGEKAGQIILRAADRFIGRAFRDIDVGIEPIRSDRVLVNAGPLVIGTISCKTKAPMKPIVSKQASGFFL